jgi:hypothetical protein
MKIIRLIGSLAFILGLFTVIFVGIPWYVYHYPGLPWWLSTAVYCLVGSSLVVLLTVAAEQRKDKTPGKELPLGESWSRVLLQNSTEVTGRQITEILSLVRGHTIFTIWLGRDVSA